MLFFVDAMLGNIAKKLRLLGFDSEYFSDIDDSELLERSQNEDRIIISKDQNLIKRAERMGIQSVHISKENELEQFQEIHKNIRLEFNEISGDTARCPKCNFRTSQIKKSEIADKTPEKILKYHDKFWKCNGCDQIYWEGTHIKNLQEFVGKIKRLI
ncbi:MAG: Mut7-C RNAse domain-containing protein [Nitrosopumilus sp.]|nr:Mut7-C RNAse domain-containing protein [Nitrosopumilus sp.]